MSGASKGLLALLVAGSMLTAVGGVIVGNRAVQCAEAFKGRALAWHDKAQELQRRLDASQAVRAELEAKLKAKPAPAPAVGRAGTLSRAARNYVNVKTPNGRPNYWKGQVGIDRHGHAVFKSPEWSLRAGAIVLRNYARRHHLNTIEGIVKRFSTCNHKEYIAFLCRRLGLKPDEPFNVVRRMPELLPAMVKFETGRAVAPEHVAILDFLKES
jgi:hypothetical protein